MAHVGKLFPVAFRRDLNLETIDNRKYLARAWAATAHGCAGTWGSTLNGFRATDVHEVSPVGAELERWTGGPYVHSGRTFSLILTLTQGTGFIFKLQMDLIDSALGNLGPVRFSYDLKDNYSFFNLGGQPTEYPHPLLYRFDFATAGWDLLRVEWPEYNVLHP